MKSCHIVLSLLAVVCLTVHSVAAGIDLLHKTGWVTSTLTPDSTDTPRFSRLHILVYFTQNDPKLAYLAMFALAVLQD